MSRTVIARSHIISYVHVAGGSDDTRPFAALKFLPPTKRKLRCHIGFLSVSVNLFVVASEPMSRAVLDHPTSTDLPVRFRRCPSLYS